MTRLPALTVVLVASLAVAGCTGGRGINIMDVGGNPLRESNVRVPTGQQLQTPTALNLPPPGQGGQAYEEPEVAYEVWRTKRRFGNIVPKDVQKMVLPANPGQADYDKYGISRFHDDGSPKSREEMLNELAFRILQAKKGVAVIARPPSAAAADAVSEDNSVY